MPQGRLTCGGLTKSSIGDFLGENTPFSLGVLAAFAKLHDFTGAVQLFALAVWLIAADDPRPAHTGQSFDAALRAYLASFRLPGESQKIDRLMETFATQFVACNPGVFRYRTPRCTGLN